MRPGGGALLALVVAAAACGGGGHGSASKTTTTIAAVSTTTLDPTREAIIAAYRASWTDFIAVAHAFPVNPLDGRLQNHDTGKQLTAVRQGLTKLMLLRHYDEGPAVELNPVVSSLTDDTALITDCLFDRSVEVDAQTNRPVEQPDVGHSLVRSTMTRVNGSWYVADSVTVTTGQREDTCKPSAG